VAWVRQHSPDEAPDVRHPMPHPKTAAVGGTRADDDGSVAAPAGDDRRRIPGDAGRDGPAAVHRVGRCGVRGRGLGTLSSPSIVNTSESFLRGNLRAVAEKVAASTDKPFG